MSSDPHPSAPAATASLSTFATPIEEHETPRKAAAEPREVGEAQRPPAVELSPPGAEPTYQDLASFELPAGFRGRPGWFVQLWWVVQGTLFAWSPQPLYGWRRFLLRLFGMKVGKGVLIRQNVRITYPWRVTIGDHSWVGDNAELYSIGDIWIGKHVVISQRAYVCAGGHDYHKPTFDIFSSKITIHDQAWLATDVFVAPGVTIGRGTVVGARSNIFGDLPAGMLCLGSPARPIRPRTPPHAANTATPAGRSV